MEIVNIIGGGLAGCEAAWQAAQRGIKVRLFEMRPGKMTAAHRTELLAELVCSNSLKSNDLHTASGLLKEELRHLNSLIIQTADLTKIPAGAALAVDRAKFSRAITGWINSHPNIEVINQEISSVPDEGITVIATGPLTSEGLCTELQRLTGKDQLFFYDAISPIVDSESVDFQKAFWASRYGKGEGRDYLNCPMNKEEYNSFYEELVRGQKMPLKPFEGNLFFEGCLPVEEIARRGRDSLLFGPLKPVGISHPMSGQTFHAIVQLRREDLQGTMLNLVGFQTRLIRSEQERIFHLIPGLEKVDFLRFGSLHRNTYLNAPALLRESLQLREHPRLFIAGQLTGVEGYVESTAAGLVAGINAAQLAREREHLIFPPETSIGSLCGFICSGHAASFQPMNINLGLLPPLSFSIKNKREKKALLASRSLEKLALWRKTVGSPTF